MVIDFVFVNDIYCIVLYGVQEFGVSDYFVIFVVKKVGVCKVYVEICDVRFFKYYNKNYFWRDIVSVFWSVIEFFDDINDVVVVWKFWIINDFKELMVERDYVLRVVKRFGNQEQWNEYCRLKNFMNRKIKLVEVLYYKNLIELVENFKDMWCLLNFVIGFNNQGGFFF